MYLISLGAGILVGEQIVPVAKRMIDGAPLTKAWFASECRPRITGVPPGADKNAADDSRHG